MTLLLLSYAQAYRELSETVFVTSRSDQHRRLRNTVTMATSRSYFGHIPPIRESKQNLLLLSQKLNPVGVKINGKSKFN